MASRFFKSATKVAKKADDSTVFSGRKSGPPFQIPEAEGFFEQVLLDICAGADDKKLEKGFLDLDKEWLSATKDEILQWEVWENYEGEDADFLETTRLYREQYPSPFCQRKAYFAQFGIEQKKIMVTGEDGKEAPMKDANGKEILRWQAYGFRASTFDKEKWDIRPQFCVFHNPELGWKPAPKTKKVEVINDEGIPEMREVKADSETEYRYIGVGCRMPREVMELVKAEVKKVGKQNDENPKDQAKYLPALVLVYAINTSDRFAKDDTEKKKPIGKWYNADLDMVIF